MNTLDKTVAKMKKNKVPLEQNCTFTKLTTFGVGGKIYLTVYPQTVRQLVFVARYLRRHNVRHCFLGHGSNVLASDDDYLGVAVVTTQVREMTFRGNVVTASCGTSASKLCSELVNRGLAGGEFFGCLPATVGGAIACNAGCFGQSVEQVVRSVTVLYKGRKKRLPVNACGFGVRNSVFKNNGDYLILSAELEFSEAAPTDIQRSLTAMRQKKAETQPLGSRSAGCVLYSETTAVSKLIDEAGLKGFRIGGAAVSEKHAGFVINLDKATAKDIYLLIQYLQNAVRERYGITPKTEICFINFDAA